MWMVWPAFNFVGSTPGFARRRSATLMWKFFATEAINRRASVYAGYRLLIESRARATALACPPSVRAYLNVRVGG